QGKHFNNKLWNALKLIKMWEAKNDGNQSESNADLNNDVNNNFAIEWFESRLNQARTEVNEQMTNFKLSEALKTIYSLVWDDFCSWFLEWIKPAYEKNIDSATYQKALYFFDELLHLLHPFMPFITEEIYHLLRERKEDLMVKQYSAIGEVNDTILQSGDKLKELITAIRDTRNKNQIKPKETIQLNVETTDENSYSAFQSILLKQINADAITFNEEQAASAATIVLGNDKIFIQCETEVDTEAQKQRLDKDLQYLKGFLIAVEKKLSNDKFVQNAKPEVIDLERKKKADVEAKIKLIEHSLSSL
ncbi:MAG: class I tRNA ligase family protein, partial [Ginsengibacter sp.]